MSIVVLCIVAVGLYALIGLLETLILREKKSDIQSLVGASFSRVC